MSLLRRRDIRLFFLVLALASFGAACLVPQAQARERYRPRKYTPPPPTSTITVTVVRGTSGKPVPNAAVIFHPIEKGKDKGSLELKSNEDGIAKIDVIPIGDTVRLQVIADGWQTYGQDYKIDADKKEITVKLQRPVEQYSLYRKDDGPSKSDNPTPQGKSYSAKPNGQVPIPGEAPPK